MLIHAFVSHTKVHGEGEVLQSLEGCTQMTERQLNEFRAKYSATMNRLRI